MRNKTVDGERKSLARRGSASVTSVVLVAALALTLLVVGVFALTSRLRRDVVAVPTQEPPAEEPSQEPQSPDSGPSDILVLGSDGNLTIASRDTGAETKSLRRDLGDTTLVTMNLNRDGSRGIIGLRNLETTEKCQELFSVDKRAGTLNNLGLRAIGGALSGDGQRLAYSPGTPSSTGPCIAYEVRLRDISSGAEEAWSSKRSSDTEFVGWIPLSWSSDDSKLLILNGAEESEELRILTISDKSKSLDHADVVEVPQGERWMGATFIGDDGSIGAFSQCCAPEYTGDLKAIRRNPSGEVTILATLPRGFRSLDLDRTGSHWLGVEADGALVEIQRDGTKRMIRGGVKSAVWSCGVWQLRSSRFLIRTPLNAPSHLVALGLRPSRVPPFTVLILGNEPRAFAGWLLGRQTVAGFGGSRSGFMQLMNSKAVPLVVPHPLAKPIYTRLHRLKGFPAEKDNDLHPPKSVIPINGIQRLIIGRTFAT